MIIYGSSFSPLVRKTLASLAEKGLKAEVKPVVFQDRDPAFRAASPFVDLAHCGVTLDKAARPRTASFVEAILGRPSFAPMVAQEAKFLGR